MKIYISSSADHRDKIDNIIHKLSSEIKDIVHSVMTSPKFGFSDEEVADYSYVEVTKHDDEYIKVEVRAEVSYGGLTNLMDKLDEWVSKYDSNAYFDAETAGITNAFIDISKASKKI